MHVVSEKRCDFGGGVGDINGDGRPDIIRPNAWFEAPADLRNGAVEGASRSSWEPRTARPTHTPQILVYDVNGDGLNDIITSSAHGYGIFWYEQVRKGAEITWKQHLIDDTLDPGPQPGPGRHRRRRRARADHRQAVHGPQRQRSRRGRPLGVY